VTTRSFICSRKRVDITMALY